MGNELFNRYCNLLCNSGHCNGYRRVFKSALILLSLMLISCAPQQPNKSIDQPKKLGSTNIAMEFLDDNDGPSELIMRNKSPGAFAMTEVRAIGNIHQVEQTGSDILPCAMDMGVVSSNYGASDKSLTKNHAFLVSESACSGMQIKANFGAIELINIGPTFVTRIKEGRIEMPTGAVNCPSKPLSGVTLCVDASDTLWVNSQKGSVPLN